MIKIFFVIVIAFSSGIYSLSTTSSGGSAINLSDFRGKKILFVNTATNSAYVSQYAKLEQLYQTYKDSLVIIAVPSNDFNNEPGTDSTIQDFVNTNYSISYLLASKQSVSGDSISPLYSWLTSAAQNGVLDNPVVGDFCKFLVDANGNIVGAFNGSVDPMDSVIQNAITN